MKTYGTDFIIGFDASPVTGRKTGVEYYSLQLYRALKEVLGREHIIAFSNQPVAEIPEAKIYPSKLPLVLWRQLILPGALKRNRVSTLHSPVTAIPFFAACPAVATVHDLSYRLAPEGVSWKYRCFQKLNCFIAVTGSEKVVTVSDTTRQHLCRYYPAWQEKFTAVLSGALANPLVAEVKNSSGHDGCPYFVQIGRLDKRKEPLTSLEAFKRSGVYKNYRFMLIGSPGNEMENITQWLKENPEVAERVSLSGYLSENEVYQALANADALLYPSRDEGFGHPPFEALSLGTLPIVSDIPVLCELLQDAAVFVPSGNADVLADEMKKLAAGKIDIAGIFSAGEKRLSALQWHKTAEKIIELHSGLCRKQEKSK